MTAAEIAAAETPAGGWTRETLAGWGVPWPPPKGWRKVLIAGEDVPKRLGRPDDVCCLTCVFWIVHGDGGVYGDCRRHAPRPIVYANVGDDQEAGGAGWAETKDDEFCGDHRAEWP